MVQIVPLSAKRLEEAARLADAVFPPEYEEKSEKAELQASLFPEDFQDLFFEAGIQPDLRYWVAIGQGKVVGLVGLYRYTSDKEAEWLGWYLVDPSARKQGIGTNLLQFAIKTAKKRGRKFLRLYSTNDPAELDSHRLFQKHGFLLVERRIWKPNPNLTKLIFELSLRAQG